MSVSEEFQSLLEEMVTSDPAQRPTLEAARLVRANILSFLCPAVHLSYLSFTLKIQIDQFEIYETFSNILVILHKEYILLRVI